MAIEILKAVEQEIRDGHGGDLDQTDADDLLRIRVWIEALRRGEREGL